MRDHPPVCCRFHKAVFRGCRLFVGCQRLPDARCARCLWRRTAKAAPRESKSRFPIDWLAAWSVTASPLVEDAASFHSMAPRRHTVSALASFGSFRATLLQALLRRLALFGRRRQPQFFSGQPSRVSGFSGAAPPAIASALFVRASTLPLSTSNLGAFCPDTISIEALCALTVCVCVALRGFSAHLALGIGVGYPALREKSWL